MQAGTEVTSSVSDIDLIRNAMIDASKRGVTQADMSKATGIPQSTISKIINGHRSTLQGPKWITLVSFLKGVTTLPLPYIAEGLLGALQDMMATDCLFIPLRKAGGGMGGSYDDGSREIESYFPVRREQVYRIGAPLNKLSFVHARGDSMYPTINESAAVLIDETDIIPENGKIYYLLFQERYLIKRVEVDDQGRIVALISDNGPVRREIGEQETVEIIGRCRLQQSEL